MFTHLENRIKIREIKISYHNLSWVTTLRVVKARYLDLALIVVGGSFYIVLEDVRLQLTCTKYH